jgi:hypothetical protein
VVTCARPCGGSWYLFLDGQVRLIGDGDRLRIRRLRAGPGGHVAAQVNRVMSGYVIKIGEGQAGEGAFMFGRFAGAAGLAADGTSECATIRIDLGVYVLGAISAADRAAVVEHLASCGRCREELAGLARLPGLLRTVPAQAAAAIAAGNGRRDPAPPARLKARLIRRVARRRRR